VRTSRSTSSSTPIKVRAYRYHVFTTTKVDADKVRAGSPFLDRAISRQEALSRLLVERMRLEESHNTIVCCDDGDLASGDDGGECPGLGSAEGRADPEEGKPGSNTLVHSNGEGVAENEEAAPGPAEEVEVDQAGLQQAEVEQVESDQEVRKKLR